MANSNHHHLLYCIHHYSAINIIALFFTVLVVLISLSPSATTTTPTPFIEATNPAIVANGSFINNFGNGLGSSGFVYMGRLSASGSEVVFTESNRGPVIASTVPYVFLRTGTAGSRSCTADGRETSSPGTALVLCRQLGGTSSTFRAYKYSDLSVQKFSGNDPLYHDTITCLDNYAFMMAPDTIYLMVAEAKTSDDGYILRIDVTDLRGTGPVDTKIAQDTGSSGLDRRYGFGVCNQTLCYFMSNTRKVNRFSVGNATTDPAFVSSLDLAAHLTNAISPLGHMALDNANELLYITSTTAAEIAKVDVATFTFVSAVDVAGMSSIYLCESCLIRNGAFLLALGEIPNKLFFVETSTMTALSGASELTITGNGRAAYIIENGLSFSGAHVDNQERVQKFMSVPPTLTKTGTFTRNTSMSRTQTLSRSISRLPAEREINVSSIPSFLYPNSVAFTANVALLRLPSYPSESVTITFGQTDVTNPLTFNPTSLTFQGSDTVYEQTFTIASTKFSPFVNLTFALSGTAAHQYDIPDPITIEVRQLENVTVTGVPSSAMLVGEVASVDVAITRLPVDTSKTVIVTPSFGDGSVTFSPTSLTWTQGSADPLTKSLNITAVSDTPSGPVSISWAITGTQPEIYNSGVTTSVTAIDVNTTTTTTAEVTNATGTTTSTDNSTASAANATTSNTNNVTSNVSTTSPLLTNSTTTTTMLGPSSSSTTSTTTTVTSTTTQTSAAPVTAITYAPLPSNLNDTVIQKSEANVAPDSPLKEVDTAASIDSITQVLERINTRSKQTDAAGATLSAPVSTTTSFFVPYQGLGQFIVKPTAECKLNPSLEFRIDLTGTKVDILPSATGTNDDAEAAMKDCIFFNPSPETIARNLSKQKFLGVTLQSGSEEATTALALESVRFNTGPSYALASSNCSTTVPRGSGFAARFTRDLGYVFVHPLGLPMTITSTGADLFPLPRAVKTSPNASGFITVRGNIETSDPLEILFTASDGFTSPVTATCTLIPVFIDLYVKNQMTTPTNVHVGSSFTFFIPNDMFESSSDFRIEYVVQDNRLPLPNGISFQRPNLVTGRLPGVGLFRFLVVAADEFREVQSYILINGTNRAPVPTFNTNVSNVFPLGRAFAARAMNKEINLAPIFSDPDDDALRYFMNTTQLAAIPWLRVEVSPGGYTKSPQNLVISGSVPREARGTNYSLQLSCTDNYNTTTIETKLSIAQGEAPIQIKDLPVYTVAPKEVLAEQIQIGEYFISPEGDQMLVGYVIRPVVTWVTINNNPGTGGAPPTLAVTASRDTIEDAKVEIDITVSNALGDSVNATATINIVRTDWQKIRQVGTIVAAALGVITSILGTIVYYPHIVNAVLGRRLVKKCPLHHTTPRFKFPDKTVRFECSIRSRFEICGSDLFKIFDFFNHYLYNRLTLKPTPNSRPPVWLNVQDRRMVLVLPPPPDDHVGIKTVICRFWLKSNFLAEEFEAVYDECYNGYVYDEAQVEKNAAFTGERERKGPAKAKDFDDFDDFEEEMSPRNNNNNNNNKSLSLAPVAAAASTAAAVTIPDSFMKKQQALEFELSETKASTTRQQGEIQEMKQIIKELLGARQSHHHHQGFEPRDITATFADPESNSFDEFDDSDL